MLRSTIAMMAVVAVLAAPVRGDLVAYWDFDEGTRTTAYDFGAGGNDGTLLADGGDLPAWVAGRTGAAGDFALRMDGDRSFVLVPHSPAFDGLSSLDGRRGRFTIAFWTKRAPGAGLGYLLHASSPGLRPWYIRSDGDGTYLCSDVNVAWDRNFGFTIPGDEWHHVAATYSPTGILTLHLNGMAISSYDLGSNLPGFTDSLRIGGWGGIGESFEGAMDDVIIFDSVENVASIMAGTHPSMVPEPAMMALMALGSAGILVVRAPRPSRPYPAYRGSAIRRMRK